MRLSSFTGRSCLAWPCHTYRQLLAAAALAAAFLTTTGAREPASGESTAPPSAPATAPARQPIAAARPEPPKPTEFRLAYKFLVNQDVRMPLAVDAEIHVQKGPSVTNSTNQSLVDRHYHINSVESDGSAIVDLFIDKVRLSYAFNGGRPIVYDTSKDPLPPRGFEEVSRSIGPHGRVRFTPQGGLLPLSGGAPSDPATDPSESFLDLLPANPVKIGDEWFDDIKVKVAVSRNLAQKITMRRRYRLEAVNGNLATIHLRTTEITPISDPQMRIQLLQRAPEGNITFDIDRGVTVSRDLDCSRTETGAMGEGSQIVATTHWKGTLR
jgi:hypothetical protein